MWLTKLEADRVRNLEAVDLDLPAGLTVVLGRNGQGKTSLLESAYLLGTGRSFRSRRLDDLVARASDLARVGGEVSSRVGRSRLAVVLERDERRLVADGQERDLESYLGRLDVVDLSAERMKVLSGPPSERRRFLDRGVLGIRPSYLRALAEYRRALHQRNALLRRAGPGTDAELDAWDERLVAAAAGLHEPRRKYALRLATGLGEIGRALFASDRELRLRYRPSPAETGDEPPERFRETYARALGRGRERDRAVGHTCVGPHRDDAIIELDETDLRRFGSAGQARAAMIALKVGKIRILRDERGESPLFLMDDFDTDLDELRASSLAEFLQHGAFQVLVATSKEAMIDRLSVVAMKVRMDGGTARPA
jgi:DNA replication and repair protein RecF